MIEKKSLRIAIIQEAPTYLDIEKSMEKAAGLIRQASQKKAELVVFGETWLTGYPAWIDHCPQIARWGYEPTKEIFAKMMASSITVPGQKTDQLASLAKQYNMSVAIGINEKVESGPGNGTIFNTFLLFDPHGELMIHHRKLMPTFNEKLLYGMGDGYGLKTASLPWGRTGGLICWEHWMPLARQALHLQGEMIHIALWPEVHDIHQLASRHYAFEGRCFVIAVGQITKISDIPAELETLLDFQSKPKMLLKGGSCLIAPDGRFILSPQFNTEGLLMAEIKDLDMCIRERITLDTSGHYNRNDVFKFSINTKRE